MNLASAKIIGFFTIPAPSMAEHNPAAYSAAMQGVPAGAGTCAHCGNGIRHHVVVNDNGTTRFIGTTCAEKVGLDKHMVANKLTHEQVEARCAANRQREAARAEKEARELAEHVAFHEVRKAADAPHAASIVEAIGVDVLTRVANGDRRCAADVAEALLGGDMNCNGYRMNSVSMYRLAEAVGKLAGRRNSKACDEAEGTVIDAFSDDIITYLESTPAQPRWTARKFYA